MRVFCIIVALFLSAGAASASEKSGNRLAGNASPYLALHADDLVHWRTWGPEALAEAKDKGKLIFISIGYFACHWCHVMQRDNFKDPEASAMMNAQFVNILIDREERPDVDSAFMQAASSMGFSTGWPLNLILTPDAKPIFGGTYFPPERRRGMPSFMEFLTFVTKNYADDPTGVTRLAAANFDALSQPRQGDKMEMTSENVIAAARTLLRRIDIFHGGFGERVKFPFIPALRLIWRAYLRTGDYEFRDAVLLTLDSMVLGGLYDHIGGGFARYTTDRAWKVPHFEKMLYVNAQMLALMTEVWRETRSPLLEARVRDTVRFLFDEMRLPGGGFAAALDSDSHDQYLALREGAYYVWSAAEIDAVLGRSALLFKRAYGVVDRGNWNGTNVLYQRRIISSQLATDVGISRAALDARLGKSRRLLAAARARRFRPARDDKVLADWNGVVIAALTEAGAVFGETTWIDAARETFDFVVQTMSVEGHLAHMWRDGDLGRVGLLEDYAQMANAALTLFERTGEATYLERAISWVVSAKAMREERSGAYYNIGTVSDSAEIRMVIGDDNQLPSGNAVMADVLARLYYLTGKDTYREGAARIVVAFNDEPVKYPTHYAGLFLAADTLNDSVQVVIVGDREASTALIDTVWRTSLPGRTFELISDGETLPETHPAFGKTMIDSVPTAYVCVGTFCSLPVQTADELSAAMHEIRRTARPHRGG
jgi:uncharacterized protein YyaL (SSP411 family)